MFDANQIGNEIQRFPGKRTCSMGALVASAGMTLVTFFDKENVSAASNCQGMVHDPIARPIIRHVEDYESDKTLYENLRNDVIDRIVAHTGLDRDEVDNMLRKTTWMNAKTLKQKGFIGTVLTSKGKVPGNAKNILNEAGIEFPMNLADDIDEDIQIDNNSEHNMKEIAKNLGLPENATEEQIIAAQNRLKSESAVGKQALLNLAKSKGIDEKLITIAVDNNFTEASEYVANFTAPEQNQDGNEGEGNEGAQNQSPDNIRLSDVINALRGEGGDTPKPDKKWNDYTPEQREKLEKDDPKLFNQLFDEEFKN